MFQKGSGHTTGKPSGHRSSGSQIEVDVGLESQGQANNCEKDVPQEPCTQKSHPVEAQISELITSIWAPVWVLPGGVGSNSSAEIWPFEQLPS